MIWCYHGPRWPGYGKLTVHRMWHHERRLSNYVEAAIKTGWFVSHRVFVS